LVWNIRYNYITKSHKKESWQIKKEDGYYCDICKLGIHEVNLVIKKYKIKKGNEKEFHYHSICLKQKENKLNTVLNNAYKQKKQNFEILEKRIWSIAIQFTVITILLGLVVWMTLKKYGGM